MNDKRNRWAFQSHYEKALDVKPRVIGSNAYQDHHHKAFLVCMVIKKVKINEYFLELFLITSGNQVKLDLWESHR